MRNSPFYMELKLILLQVLLPYISLDQANSLMDALVNLHDKAIQQDCNYLTAN